MKRSLFLVLLLALLLYISVANADKARFLKEDRNVAYHSQHLTAHVGSKDLKVSGNYIKVRSSAGSKKVLGHLEQSDAFTLDAIEGDWAKITVIYAAKTSPDSFVGLSGWVDADYVECPCSSYEYYNGPVHLFHSLAITINDTTHLREDPSKQSTSLATIKKGEIIEILSEYKNSKWIWYRVRYGQQMGFIRSDLVEITAEGIMPGETLTPVPALTPEPTLELSPEPTAEVTIEPILESTDETVSDQFLMVDSNNEPILLSPDQSLPLYEETDQASAGRGLQESNTYLTNLQTYDNQMLDCFVNTPSYLCLTVNSHTESGSPIYLVIHETNAVVGIMRDDGTAGDQIAGDQIYTIGFTVSADQFGKLIFVARQDETTSNQVVVRFYEFPTEENSESAFELINEQQEAVSEYLDSDGYVSTEDKPYAMSAVEAFVKEQYFRGTISEYDINSESIVYREVRTGITLVYTPPIEGLLAAGGYDQIMLIQPEQDTQSDETPDKSTYGSITEKIAGKFYYSYTELNGSDVTPETIKQFMPGQIILWNGHGVWSGYPGLVTGTEFGLDYWRTHIDDFIHKRLSVSTGLSNRIIIGPTFIDNYCNDLSDCFIWLGSCFSGQDDSLANSFLKKGASVIIGYSGPVLADYDAALISHVMSCMAGEDETSIEKMRVRDAIDKAIESYGVDDIAYRSLSETDGQVSTPEFKREPSHVVLFGDEGYRF